MATETQETIVDIIKKTRAEADFIEKGARGSLKAGETWDGRPFTESDLESALDLAETKRKEANRLEAALGRERGDTAKVREALKKCLLYIACAESVGVGVITLNDKVKLDPKKIIKSAKKALAATEKEGGTK